MIHTVCTEWTPDNTEHRYRKTKSVNDTRTPAFDPHGLHKRTLDNTEHRYRQTKSVITHAHQHLIHTICTEGL